LLAPISRELGLGREAHAVLLGASLGATALGGALFGYLADRFGRKAVLEWSILTYSAGTVLCGLAPEVATLLAARVVTGLGVGGEWAIGHALLGETVPPRLRGRFGALLQTGAPAGVGLAAIVGSFVAPHIGWRAAFVLSGLPALLVTAIRRTLPESDLWQRAAARPRLADLLAPGLRRHVGLAFGLAVLNMSSYWFTYTWLPTYLTEERGLSIASSGLKILVVVCGELLGYASFGLVSDRVGRKPAFSLYAMLMAAGLVSITLLWRAIEGWPPLLLFCLWIVGFGTGTWSNFGPMFAELFPTRLRTTAVGTVFNAARGVQAVRRLREEVLERLGLAVVQIRAPERQAVERRDVVAASALRPRPGGLHLERVRRGGVPRDAEGPDVPEHAGDLGRRDRGRLARAGRVGGDHGLDGDEFAGVGAVEVRPGDGPGRRANEVGRGEIRVLRLGGRVEASRERPSRPAVALGALAGLEERAAVRHRRGVQRAEAPRGADRPREVVDVVPILVLAQRDGRVVRDLLGGLAEAQGQGARYGIGR